MKNLPIRKEIEELLEQVGTPAYFGVWKIKDKNKYLKLKVRIPLSDFESTKEALEAVVRCAKVYQRFVEEGLYHPNTTITICKDESNLALMVMMPELIIKDELSYDLIKEKLNSLSNKLNLDDHVSSIWGDLNIDFNWGYDEKTKKFYAHDLHIASDYKEILNYFAEKMGIR